MRNTYLFLSLVGLGLIGLATIQQNKQFQREINPELYKAKLSEYDFFEGGIKSLKPKEGIVPYYLNTPLFSDHAHKMRYIKLPKGKQVALRGNQMPEFPEGTMLIKHFYYPKDFSKPLENLHFVETRILIKEEDDFWVPLCYVWDADQKDAQLNLTGVASPVSWIDEQGKSHKLDYQIPSLLQCRYCHTIDNELRPLGPEAQQLHGEYREPTMLADMQGKQQLEYWKEKGLLASSASLSSIEAMPVWNDANTGSLDKRARAWLHVNCAHCHRPNGSAEITGLLLNYEEQNPEKIGVNKKPMTGMLANDARTHDIVPGHPEKSILVHRIESEDPSLRMPKISCQVPDHPGVELISQWIREMN